MGKLESTVKLSNDDWLEIMQMYAEKILNTSDLDEVRNYSSSIEQILIGMDEDSKREFEQTNQN